MPLCVYTFVCWSSAGDVHPHARKFWVPSSSQHLSSSISSKYYTKGGSSEVKARPSTQLPQHLTMHTPSHFLLLTIFSKQHPITHFGCLHKFFTHFSHNPKPAWVMGLLYCWFFFFLPSGLIKVAVSEEGICSMPRSVINSDSDSKPLYWKVTNPTLSPSHLQGNCDYNFVFFIFLTR